MFMNEGRKEFSEEKKNKKSARHSSIATGIFVTRANAGVAKKLLLTGPSNYCVIRI